MPGKSTRAARCGNQNPSRGPEPRQQCRLHLQLKRDRLDLPVQPRAERRTGQFHHLSLERKDLPRRITRDRQHRPSRSGHRPAANQADPAEFSWEVDTSLADTTPPETTIISKPTDPTNSSTAYFTYESNEPGSTFECKLDAAASQPVRPRASPTWPRERAAFLPSACHRFQRQHRPHPGRLQLHVVFAPRLREDRRMNSRRTKNLPSRRRTPGSPRSPGPRSMTARRRSSSRRRSAGPASSARSMVRPTGPAARRSRRSRSPSASTRSRSRALAGGAHRPDAGPGLVQGREGLVRRRELEAHSGACGARLAGRARDLGGARARRPST